MQIHKAPPKRAFSGLAGSSLSVVSTPVPQVPKTIKKDVLVHFCFDQERGDSKDGRCGCSLRVTRNRAYELVDAKQADFLLIPNPKTEKLVKFHLGIVVRRVKVAGELLFALEPPTKPDRRDVKHQQIKGGILHEARQILRKLFKSGAISHADLQMSEEDLITAISSPDPFLAKIKSYKKDWLKISLHWWNNALGYRHLNADVGKYLDGADHGKGLPVYSKTGNADAISDASENYAGRVVGGANFVPRKWNGGFIYDSGSAPDKFDVDDSGEPMAAPDGPQEEIDD